MAGDWIKMRTDLSDDPAVISMAELLHTSPEDIVGRLHKLWSWADRHTLDGYAVGITSSWVDRYCGAGFSEAIIRVGWLAVEQEGIRFPNFDRHNGQSAKKRADATIRQRLSRSERDNHVTGTPRHCIPSPFKKFVMTRDGYCCVYCGERSSAICEASKESVLTIDHIVPASRGGKPVVDNLVCCCKLCNNEKNDRTPEEWGLLPTFLQDGVTYLSQQICDNRVTKTSLEKRREEIHHHGAKTASVGDAAGGHDDDADLKPMTAYLRTVVRGLDLHAGILDGLRKHVWTLDELRAAWQAITERKGVKNKQGLLSAKIVAGEKVKPVAITVSIGTTKAAEDKARAEMDTSSVPLGTQLKKALLGKVV